MKRVDQKMISLFMTAVYLLITLSPLVSTGFHSKSFFPSVNSECSGDCGRCGCSAERSAARACCCWQKKQAIARVQKNRAQSQPASTDAAVKAGRSCCRKSAQHHDHKDEATVSARYGTASDPDSKTVSISSCPCGSGRDIGFSGADKSQHVPFRFLSGVPIQSAAKVSFSQPNKLFSRYGEPPDPPPKLFIS